MAAENQARTVSPLRVLVVDDEALIRWAVSETLSRAGHVVVQAGDGSAALQAMRDAAPIDVVLMDLKLPDSADLSLLSRIRRQWPDSAVVMMTAHGSAEVAAAALALGVYEVLGKPFDVREIERAVEDAHLARVH
jgi:DNA-binding NtrC family response regulator